jgi:hypothetical protein
VPTTTPPQIALREFLGSTTRHIRRVEIYEADGLTRWSKDTELRLKDGTVSVDQNRDERRTLDLQLANADGVLVNAPDEFWYDKIIKVFRGVRINQPTRTPKILIITDKAGPETLASSFRDALVTSGFGDVLVNTTAYVWGDVLDFDIIVGLGGAVESQVELFQEAYEAGKSVYLQDADAAAWMEAYHPTALSIYSTDRTVAPLAGSPHPASKAWQEFENYTPIQLTNLDPDPRATTATNWPFGLGTGGAATLSNVTGASDGPVLSDGSKITTYRRAEVTTAQTAGSSGPYRSVFVSGSAGQTANIGMWIRANRAVSGIAYFRFYNGSTVVGSKQVSVTLPLNQWLELSDVVTSTGDYTSTRVWFVPSGGSYLGVGDIFHWTGGRTYYEPEIQPYVDGDMTDTQFYDYAWTSTANASTSTRSAIAGRSYDVSGISQASVISADPVDAIYSRIVAYAEPIRGGRLIAAHLPFDYNQYDVPQVVNMLASFFGWLNTVKPMLEWECQIGEFMIDRITERHFPYDVSLTGRDYTKKCMGSKFLYATQFASGMALESIIASIAGAAGITKRSLPTTGVVVAREFFFDRGVSRWEAMKEIATAYDYEIFFDATGFLILRPYSDPVSTSPVLVLKTGRDGGQLGSYEKSTTDTRIYNVVLVTGESSDADSPPVYAVARNDDPNSPTSTVNIGERVYEYSSSFIETTPQAQQVADSFLAVHALEEFELGFSSLMLPWLEAGDIVGFVDPRPAPGDPTTFLLSDFSIPLGLGLMDGKARRVTNVS